MRERDGRPAPGTDDYLSEFLVCLAAAETIASAQALALHRIQPNPAGGDACHANLLHFLAAFEGRPGGFGVDRSRPLVPSTATEAERHAYRELAGRLVRSGQLGAEDARFVERELTGTSGDDL